MKAIEIKSKTDKEGHLKLEYKLNKSEQKVRILILVDEDSPDDEKTWLNTVSNNPAFDFLNDPAEDIYTLKDGKKIDD